MRKISLGIAAMLALATIALAAPVWDKNPSDFIHGIALDIDGETWYFAGPGSVPGARDIPGHTWVQDPDDPDQLAGRHYNVGPPLGPDNTPLPSWWAREEPDGVLLYKVHGIIAPTDLDMKTADKLKNQGYVHRHELVNSTGYENPTMVVYLKHIAVRKFFFDSPPMPAAAHDVTPGVDYEFIPNW